MNKSFLLFCSLVFTLISSTAQSTWGIHIGPNLSIPTSMSDTVYASRVGAYFGGDVYFGKNLRIGLNLNNVAYTTSAESIGQPDGLLHYDYYNLEIPVEYYFTHEDYEFGIGGFFDRNLFVHYQEESVSPSSSFISRNYISYGFYLSGQQFISDYVGVRASLRYTLREMPFDAKRTTTIHLAFVYKLFQD